jgi:hypothetical protein
MSSNFIVSQAPTNVRNTRANLGEATGQPLQITKGGELITAEGLPKLTEIVRQGKSFYGKGVVTTATLNQTLPTTAAASTLWNGNGVGGASYVLEGVGIWTDVSGGAANVITPYIEPSIVFSATVPTTVEAGVIRNLRLGAGTYSGSAKISQTVTVTDNGWLALTTYNTAALTANLGIGMYIPLNGLFVIPPGYYVAMHSVGTAATAEVGYYYVWHEVQLDLP